MNKDFVFSALVGLLVWDSDILVLPVSYRFTPTFLNVLAMIDLLGAVDEYVQVA